VLIPKVGDGVIRQRFEVAWSRPWIMWAAK